MDTNFEMYWKSISAELKATKSRVRSLIADRHWPSDGTYKEVVLRNVVRRHLPENLTVATGFVVKEDVISTQIDLLVIDKSAFTLFKEGDFAVVTPNAVRAIIEVKTQLRGPAKIRSVVEQLSENAELISNTSSCGPHWAGLFVYDSNNRTERGEVLETVKDACTGRRRGPVDCIAYGKDTFIRYDTDSQHRWGWTWYDLSDLAFGYFVGNLIATVCRTSLEDQPVLFPLPGGKQRRALSRVVRFND